ncbi:MAG: alginate lyase family protein [Acidimicrobiales bacterium]
MSAAEIGWRLEDRVRQEAWARRFGPGTTRATGIASVPTQASATGRALPRMPEGVDLSSLSGPARRSLLAEADDLLRGRIEILGVVRDDIADPDWALDPVSRRSFPTDECAFRIDYRSPVDDRNVKQVWELSRHQHLTVLALAWRLTGDERYAALVACHLRSWWSRNQVLAGVNWASGIELGIRCISWAWTRRLLEGWPGAPSLFEENEEFARQLYWHQRYLASFRSRGSSANNHVVAEAAGLLVASCAFPWFGESDRWATTAAAVLASELPRNTFDSGCNREQAFEYHGFVAELGLVAAAEAAAVGRPLPAATWELLRRMIDVTAAVLDGAGGPPRHGDGDGGRALLLVPPGDDRWRSLLATGAALFGPLPWWPTVAPDGCSLLLGGLAGKVRPLGPRPSARPSHFADAGITILRSPPETGGELWCRCDGGPHGFLTIAAHAHADALSVELRHEGVELLVDPGTYCYQGAPMWRRYFRSTVAHNTLELDGLDQSEPGGPFLWTRHARTRVIDVHCDPPGPQRWTAEHDGYSRLAVPASHRRTVELDAAAGSITVVDRLTSDGPHDVRLAFHVGPACSVALEGHRASLRWERPTGRVGTATMDLPDSLDWSAHCGTDAPLGWYSPGFGRMVPITTLVGTGRLTTGVLRTGARIETR